MPTGASPQPDEPSSSSCPQCRPGTSTCGCSTGPSWAGRPGRAPRPGPLAKARKTSWWERVDFGRTRTGQHHTERLRGGAWFVGGKPESGKSTLAIIAAAHTILDPFAHRRR